MEEKLLKSQRIIISVFITQTERVGMLLIIL